MFFKAQQCVIALNSLQYFSLCFHSSTLRGFSVTQSLLHGITRIVWPIHLPLAPDDQQVHRHLIRSPAKFFVCYYLNPERHEETMKRHKYDLLKVCSFGVTVVHGPWPRSMYYSHITAQKEHWHRAVSIWWCWTHRISGSWMCQIYANYSTSSVFFSLIQIGRTPCTLWLKPWFYWCLSWVQLCLLPCPNLVPFAPVPSLDEGASNVNGVKVFEKG